MNPDTSGGLNPGASEHPHRQIAEAVRQRIAAGEWAPGEKLPSIPALAEAYGVAKQTAQRAVDQLRVQGLLITRPGAGTYVRGTRRRLDRLSRARYGTRRGYHVDLSGHYRQRLLAVDVVPAPLEVTQAFQVADGTPLLRRHYLVWTDTDQPVELGASWLLPAETTGTTLARTESFGRPLYQEVEEVTGRRYVTATDQLSARLPTRAEAELLQIRADTPVLHVLHIAYDGARNPVEVAEATWPGPMTTLTESYPVPAPNAADDGTDPDLALG